MAKVKLEGITRKFERTVAIQNITFEVPDGEFWVLVGPSGCGKSTILRTIAGLDAVTEGNIYIGEVLVDRLSARDRDVAMVFQNYALYPHMTVAENLGFGLKMRNIDKATIDRRVQTVAQSLDIEHLLKRKPKQLSGGQQQRVALGRAIARQPQLFLLDEPLSNLDAQLREEMRAELKQLHQKFGITTIYVTHDRSEAMTLADRIVVLERGKIQQIGTPQDIYHRPANRMVAQFLTAQPMNILPVIYQDGYWLLGENLLPVLEAIEQQIQPVQGQRFNLGIRPEHISINNSDSQANSFLVELESLEPLGREILVRGILKRVNLTINFYLPGDWQVKVGDRLQINFDLEQLFVFDPNNDRTIYFGRENLPRSG
jgi:multiple sugar transport system ATP-binding protein